MTDPIRVLHVDDDEAFGELTAEFLERESDHFEVVTEQGARAGLDRLDARIDCVVSDYDMPGTNGLEFLEAIREEHPDLPFILFTGEGSEEVASDAIAAGATDYLQKRRGTGDFELLANRIHNAVEQYRSHRHLERQRRQYQRLFEQGPVMFATFHDEDGEPVIEDCNDRFAEKLGVDRDSLRGRSMREFYTDESVATAIEGDGFERAMAGEFITEERSIEAADGRRLEVLVRAVPQVDETGTVTGTLALYIDVTEQRERERQLERQKERLDTVVSNVPMVVYALDSDGVFTFSAGKGLEKLGLEPGEVVGESVFDIYADHEGVIEDIERALAGESVSSTREVDGVIFDANVQPVVDEEGTVEAVIGVAVDITERTERERQLQRERDRVTALFENMSEAIVYYEFEDGSPTAKEVNPAFEEAFGVTERQVRGRVFDDIVVPEDRAAEGEPINERVLAGEVVDTEVDREAVDGLRTFNLLSVPLSPGESGERGFAVYTDVTERKERERNLEQYRTLVETVGDPMYILDGDGYVEFANRAMAAYVDLDYETVTGRHASEFIMEGDYERGTDIIVDVQSDPDRDWDFYEVTVVTASGERKQAECNIAPLADADGHLSGSVGVVRDISDRKRRQNAFEALHEVATTIQTERTVEAVAERTVSAGADILDFALCSVMVREGEWLVPYAISEDAPPVASRPMRIEHGLAGKTYRTGTSEIVAEVTLGDETDPTKDTYRSGISVPVGDHGVFQAVSTETDAFDSEDIEFAELLVSHAASAIERIEREAALERQNERLDEFASIVSHDLRNPLSVANGRLELAREGCDSDHLDAVAGAHDRMERLIDDLLTLARKGESVAEFESVDLAATANRCWENVDTAAATLVADTDAIVRGDPGRLQQLLENLIRNAVEHGGEDVTVTVGTLADGFYVADDGPGIPADEREAVFEFGHSSADDGTGLGLAIVDRIAGAHGWEVSVTESAAGGARFELIGVDFE
jgi:PAS domain S-box-containing protein